MAGPANNVILIGSMGSGKTTVGRRLADRLGFEFVDTDRLIEREAGMSVDAIFRTRGERRFRALERRVIERVASQRNQVIATGGGAILDPANRARLHGSGLTTWLKASPEVMAKRLETVRDRPLLRGSDRVRTLQTLLKRREPLYRRAAIHVDTSDATADRVVAEILARLRPAPRRVPVTSSQGKYHVEIGWGTLTRIGEQVASLGRTGRAGVVTNPRVAGLYAKTVTASLRAAGLRPFLVTIPDGERYKSLRTASRIYDELVRHRIERQDVLVALGGGVVGDLTGFVAATYLRGLAYVHVPTTVVAQVDSSIGGKTGVDLPSGKNLVGAFHHPILVHADIETLTTLPRREFLSGMAEVIKYGMIRDEAFFAMLEEQTGAILAKVPNVLADVVRRSAEIKAEVVAQDEREAGLRRILNYGHTVGHVVETCTGYSRYRHGEAVAVGMHFAARLAHVLERCSSDTVGRQRLLLTRFGLPVELPSLSVSRALRTMALDKKVKEGRIHFVLPSQVGRVTVDPVTPGQIRTVWQAKDIAKVRKDDILNND